MSNKTLYQQALEIYQAQQTLNSYSIEQNSAWHNWYNGLTSAEQYHLAQVAAIVSKLVNEVIGSFTEFLVSADYSELSSGIQSKFSPSSFIEAIGIETKDNKSQDQGDESSNKADAFVDTDTDVMPSDDDYFEDERNLLEIAFDVSKHQKFSKEYSLKLWFEDLTSEEQKVLQDSTETLLNLLPEVIGNYMTFFPAMFQHISQDALRNMTPIQQLWRR